LYSKKFDIELIKVWINFRVISYRTDQIINHNAICINPIIIIYFIKALISLKCFNLFHALLPHPKLLLEPVVGLNNWSFLSHVAQGFEVLYSQLFHQEGDHKGGAPGHSIGAMHKNGLLVFDCVLNEFADLIKMFADGLFGRVPDLDVEVVEFIREVGGELVSRDDDVFDSELFEVFVVLGALHVSQVDVFGDLVEVHVEQGGAVEVVGGAVGLFHCFGLY
jgi:hypothetical protein